MQLQQAKPEALATVRHITQATIQTIYPHFYPRGAVDFFLVHHSDAAMLADLAAGDVYLCYNAAGEAVGTVTVQKNAILRLFVLPQAQGNGYGRALLDFAEARVASTASEIVLDASLPAKAIYHKRGYRVRSSECIPTGNGDFLCYDVMYKTIAMTDA